MQLTALPLPSVSPAHRRLPPHFLASSAIGFIAVHFDKKFLQRALLAFTTGLFLACAARMSASGQVPASHTHVAPAVPHTR